MYQKLTFTKWGAVALALGLFVTSALSSVVLHRNLQQLAKSARRIFAGKCTSVSEHYQPNGDSPPYTEYTFEILESIKGNLGPTLTIRQYGLTKPKQVSQDLAYVGRVPGMPVYQEGKVYVLFLIGDSKLGLTSPAGLYQGAFLILEDSNGAKKVINGVSNLGLFKNLETATLTLNKALSPTERVLMKNKKGPIDYEDFLSLVRKMVTKE